MPPRPGSLADRLASDSASVMVVEDETDIATFLAAFFKASGMGMVHVNPRSPADVVEAAVAEDVSCVLLDIGLNGFSGLEALEAIRADRRIAGLPVIVVSAYNDKTTVGRARDLGIDAYVAKPFAVGELFDQVMTALSGGAAAPIDPADDALERALAGVVPPVGFALVRVQGAVGPVADALAAAVPAGGVVGRCADQEIGVLLPGSDVDATVDLLTAALEGRAATAGVAAAPDHAQTGDELYMAADAALAEAAERGTAVAVAR